jgi:hypothetical protein
MSYRSVLVVAICAVLAACTQPEPAKSSLTGAWRAQVQFSGGPFAAIKDLEFMYVIHADGTLMESSNYDEAPPVPPAYGMWRQTMTSTYQAHYEFFVTQAPARTAGLVGGWPPGGRGVLEETITMSPDGQTFSSHLHLQLLDTHGQPTDQSGDAEVHAVRIAPVAH